VVSKRCIPNWHQRHNLPKIVWRLLCCTRKFKLSVLSCGTVYYAVQGGSTFWVNGRKPKCDHLFKWKLLSSTFLRCYLYSFLIWKFGGKVIFSIARYKSQNALILDKKAGCQTCKNNSKPTETSNSLSLEMHREERIQSNSSVLNDATILRSNKH